MLDRTISITTGTIVKALLLLGAAWLLFQLSGIILIVMTAVVIASAIEPQIGILMRRRIPRVLAVMFVYLLMFFIFLSIFYFFLPPVLEDFETFIRSLPLYIEGLNATDGLGSYTRFIGNPVEGLTADALITGIRNAIGLGSAAGGLQLASVFFGGLFSFILIVVFSFYFALVGTGIDDFLRVIAPRKYRNYLLDLWRRSQYKIGLWMQGQLLLAVIVGVLVYLGLTILGVPHALTLAVIAAIFEIIPVFGPILSAIPAVIVAAVDGGATLGLLTIALYVITQQFENNLIYPLVVTRVVGVPPLLVILALIIGGQLAGFLGLLLSVPAAGAIQEFIKDITARRSFAEENT